MSPRLDPIVWTTRQKFVLWALELARDTRAEEPRLASAQRLVKTALELTETKRPQTGATP